jgi:hypothetical protein
MNMLTRTPQGHSVKFRHFTTLHTGFDSDECRRRLVESVDPERRTIFSLSGYKGSKPVIGWLDGYQFFLHKRRYWPSRNDFAPQCYGNFVAQEKGTIIECYFDATEWAKWFVKFWLVFASLLAMPIFIISLISLIKSGDYYDGSQYIGLVAPVAMVLFGIYLPKAFLEMGRGEEDFILEFLRITLNAYISESN